MPIPFHNGFKSRALSWGVLAYFLALLTVILAPFRSEETLSLTLGFFGLLASLAGFRSWQQTTYYRRFYDATPSARAATSYPAADPDPDFQEGTP